VLVASARSRDGETLDLVLYPGGPAGFQSLGFTRLKPDMAYRVEGPSGCAARIVANAAGRAELTVPLAGRTSIRLMPEL
jgi:hypothetical protein